MSLQPLGQCQVDIGRECADIRLWNGEACRGSPLLKVVERASLQAPLESPTHHHRVCSPASTSLMSMFIVSDAEASSPALAPLVSSSNQYL